MAIADRIDAATPSHDTEERWVSVLGSTGSVGRNTLDLVRCGGGRYRVTALSANTNIEALAAQAREFRPSFVAIGDTSAFADLKSALSGTKIEIAAGADAVCEVARRASDVVIAGIVGTAGLAPTLEAVHRGATVGLANKECLVSAGDLFMAEVERCGARLLPVDSEHNAIYQVFDFDRPDTVEKIVLTASGGPLRTWTREQMSSVTRAEALAHPNWSMGAKISIDSATMMNKGLEMIEAYHLFPVNSAQIEVVVHPQSIVHSMVHYVDGSVLAQLGSPDMRVPIGYALSWPDRATTPASRLDLAAVGSLAFEAPDPDRFPSLTMARSALEYGGFAPTYLNGANEVAVQAFLDGRVGFLDIARIVGDVLDRTEVGDVTSLDDIMAQDLRSRRLAAELTGTGVAHGS